MRFLAILALSLLCLVPYNQAVARKSDQVGAYNFFPFFSSFYHMKNITRTRKPNYSVTYNQFPKIHIINDTELMHNVFVEYAHGFKRVTIGGKIVIDKLVYDGNTYENFTTGKIVHDMEFSLPRLPKKPRRKDTYTYEMTVYEKNSDEIMCSSTINVSPSASDQTNSGVAGIAGQGPCIATYPENNACNIEAHSFAYTCHVELSITEPGF